MTNELGVPTERDVAAVEQRLSALWADMSPAQQALLDTIIGGGLAIATPDDTQGYHQALLSNPDAVGDYYRTRVAELTEGWRRANTPRDPGAGPAPRWDLRPLLNLVRGATAPSGGATSPARTAEA